MFASEASYGHWCTYSVYTPLISLFGLGVAEVSLLSKSCTTG